MITDWIVRLFIPALERAAARRNQPMEATAARSRDEVLHDCDTVRLSVIHVSNGTLLRMDTHSPDDYSMPKMATRRSPNIVIIKDDETIQDAVIRMLAIAQLEKP